MVLSFTKKKANFLSAASLICKHFQDIIYPSNKTKLVKLNEKSMYLYIFNLVTFQENNISKIIENYFPYITLLDLHLLISYNLLSYQMLLLLCLQYGNLSQDLVKKSKYMKSHIKRKIKVKEIICVSCSSTLLAGHE